MKKIFAITLLMMLGLAGKSQAQLFTKSISSTTFVSGFAASDVLQLNPKESMNYTIKGGATGTIVLEKSIDGGSNYIIIFSSTNNSPTGVRSGTEYAGELTSFYRFRASTMTGAGQYTVTLEDNDDFVGQLNNNKKEPLVVFSDDRIAVKKLTFSPTGDTAIAMASNSTFTLSGFPRTFVIVTATGDAIVMRSIPTVSTAAAQTGDIYIIQSTTATITLQDDGTLAGSALELGASTRALGVGDMIGLIYRAGKWWEMFFANN